MKKENCHICNQTHVHLHRMRDKWIGVDFDGTLAIDFYGRTDPYQLGEPIPAMVERVKYWLSLGLDVRLLTARMNPYSATTGMQRDVKHMQECLEEWCLKHIGRILPCTASKDGSMEVLWDDRAVCVQLNQGIPL